MEYKLNESQWNYFTALHTRCWINGDFDEQRYRMFKGKVEQFEDKDYDVSEFRRYIDIYDGYIERRNGRNETLNGIKKVQL